MYSLFCYFGGVLFVKVCIAGTVARELPNWYWFLSIADGVKVPCRFIKIYFLIVELLLINYKSGGKFIFFIFSSFWLLKNMLLFVFEIFLIFLYYSLLLDKTLASENKILSSIEVKLSILSNVLLPKLTLWFTLDWAFFKFRLHWQLLFQKSSCQQINEQLKQNLLFKG